MANYFNRNTVADSEQTYGVDFGVCDERGRTIGASIYTSKVDQVPAPVTQNWGWADLEAGQFFYFRPSATRNGILYGATQHGHYFKTGAERADAIESYLTSAKKRAAKKGAR